MRIALLIKSLNTTSRYGAVVPMVHHRCMATTSSGSEDNIEAKHGMINKLLYRSRQRGFLELDLMVGLWAEREVPKMNREMMEHFSAVLDLENPDLFKWLTGQSIPPDQVCANPAFKALQNQVLGQLGQNSQHATKAPAGSTWVRGWDDGWRKPSAAPSGEEKK